MGKSPKRLMVPNTCTSYIRRFARASPELGPLIAVFDEWV